MSSHEATDISSTDLIDSDAVEEYDDETIRDAIEAIEAVGAEPTVERVEAVSGDVESAIDDAVATADELSVRSVDGGEEA